MGFGFGDGVGDGFGPEFPPGIGHLEVPPRPPRFHGGCPCQGGSQNPKNEGIPLQLHRRLQIFHFQKALDHPRGSLATKPGISRILEQQPDTGPAPGWNFGSAVGKGLRWERAPDEGQGQFPPFRRMEPRSQRPGRRVWSGWHSRILWNGSRGLNPSPLGAGRGGKVTEPP